MKLQRISLDSFFANTNKNDFYIYIPGYNNTRVPVLDFNFTFERGTLPSYLYNAKNIIETIERPGDLIRGIARVYEDNWDMLFEGEGNYHLEDKHRPDLIIPTMINSIELNQFDNLREYRLHFIISEVYQKIPEESSPQTWQDLRIKIVMDDL